MLKQTFQSVHFSRLLAAVLLTALIADCAPHPNLGPSFVSQAFSNLIQPATAAE
ncbi:MAG: hypothetical protein AAFR99_13685 [Cyanobacteria bacterium J06629_9]